MAQAERIDTEQLELELEFAETKAKLDKIADALETATPFQAERRRAKAVVKAPSKLRTERRPRVAGSKGDDGEE